MNNNGNKITAADRELASRLGVQAQVVAELRETKLGTDDLAEGDRIKFTEAGREKVARELGLGQLIEEKETPTVGATAELRVIGKYPNPFVIRVLTPDKSVANVRVRTSTQLHVGNFISCVKDAEGWRCVHPHFCLIKP